MLPAQSRVAKLGRGHSAPPVIRVTSYDRIWSTLVALLAVLVVAVWFLFLVWDSFQPHVAKMQLAIEVIPDESGGVENGSPTESLKLEGTGPERADATPGEASDDSRPEVQDVLQSVSLEAASADAAPTILRLPHTYLKPLDLGRKFVYKIIYQYKNQLNAVRLLKIVRRRPSTPPARRYLTSAGAMLY